MKKWRLRAVWFYLFWLPLLSLRFELCSSYLNEPGRKLLGSGDNVEDFNNNGKGYDPCSRFGEQCDKDKIVVKSKVERATMRRLFISGSTHTLVRRNSVGAENDAFTGFLASMIKISHISGTAKPSAPPASSNNSTEAPSSDKVNPSSVANSPTLPPDSSPTPTKAPSSPVTSTPAHPPPPSPSQSPGEKSKAKAIGLSVGLTVGLLIALLASCVLWRHTNKGKIVMPWKMGMSGLLRKTDVSGARRLQLSELELACEDFSNIIGSLSNCKLYKGNLSDEGEIAVAIMNVTSAADWSEHHEAQFKKKISVMSKMNHKNFMNLVGYCAEENPFTRMLVYEYSPNGTLFEHLHVKEVEPLEWAARMRVAMGIVYCLQHIEKLETPLILRNLSSSSIYLTEDLAARLSDLEFWTDESSDTSNDSHQQGNVYKYGILLLELISGRLPFSEDDGLLVLWASSYLEGKRPLQGMVDTTLGSVSEEDINALAGIIKKCINPEVSERPKIKEVADKMMQITSLTPEKAYPKTSTMSWAEDEIKEP